MNRRKAGCGGRRWERVRMAVFERDGFRCRNCGRGGQLECDHIRSVQAGGDPWNPGNLQTLCRSCHAEKTTIENGGRPEGRERREWREFARRRRSENPRNA